MKDIVLVSAARTAVGAMNGSLKDVPASDLAAAVIREAVKRAGVSPDMIDEVILGMVGQIAEDGFIARASSLKAGLPLSATAYSVNRQCGSGLQAINDATLLIQTERAEAVVACGAENMNRLPYYVRSGRFGYRFGDGVLEDGLLSILTWPLGPYPNGITAENVAKRHGVTRQDQDMFALQSQEKAIAAIESGKFKDEIVPITVREKKGAHVFDTDENPRAGLTLERLSALKPAFLEGGSVTAGNSSGVTDGAAAVVMMTREKAASLGLKPLARVVDFTVCGNEPEYMGFAPALSTKKLLARVGLGIDELDLMELNEAFASQSVAVIRDLGIDPAKVNVNGGAIALGHPLGATGVILTVKLINEMARRKSRFGMVSMCIGGGQGISTLFERLD